MLVYKVDRRNAAGSVSLLLLGWAVSAPCIGWVSDRMRRRKAPALICTSLALISFSILIYGPELSLTVARGLIFLNGLFSAGMVLCFATTHEHNENQAAGSAVAFVNMWVVASGAFLQPVIGWVLDLHWDGILILGVPQFTQAAYKESFIILIITGIIAVISTLLSCETYCRPVGS
jgi:MFS family permease